MKKIIIIILIICCFGCGTKARVVKKPSSNSLTYSFFKDFDVKHYMVYFYDRNVSKNDNSTIKIGRYDDKYYYEYSGIDKRKMIQKEGFKYSITGDLKSYSKTPSDEEDFSLGILPNNIKELKTKGYKTGKENVYNRKYIFEEYKYNEYNITYYYEGKKLIYVKSTSPIGTSLFKFDKFGKVSEKIFDISEEYSEISY